MKKAGKNWGNLRAGITVVNRAARHSGIHVVSPRHIAKSGIRPNIAADAAREQAMSEIELKLLLTKEQAREILQRAGEAGIAAGKPRRRLLHSVYYDTESDALKAAGIALRLRRDGRKWLQTVKANGRVASGLSQVTEVETAAPGGRLSLDIIPDAGLREDIEQRVDGHALAPVLETRLQRTSLQLALEDGTRAELAIDDGEILASGRSGDLTEVEIELLAGDPRGLYTIARILLPEGGLTFSRYSKAARGDLLARKGYVEPPVAPRKASKVEMAPETTSEAAARDILRECLDQIATNMFAVRKIEEPEGAHQLRIGLRRLRTALSLFAPVIGCKAADNLAQEAQWLGREVGRLRDTDVARDDIVVPFAARHPAETGFQPVIVALGERLRAIRQELTKTLTGARAQRFLFDLSEFVETRGWLDPADFDQSARLAGPVADLADAAIAKRWKRTTAQAGDLDGLDHEQRHELRKELKKLRYATEFLSPLYPSGKTRKFVRSLRRLQAVFGDLNDATMIGEIFRTPPFDALGDASAQRAIGRLIGATETRAEMRWPEASALWDDLRSCKRFWK